MMTIFLGELSFKKIVCVLMTMILFWDFICLLADYVNIVNYCMCSVKTILVSFQCVI